MVRGAGDPAGVVRHAREQLVAELDEAAAQARSEALRWSNAARDAAEESEAVLFGVRALELAADAALRDWAAEMLRAAVAAGSAREAALVARISVPAAPTRPAGSQVAPIAVYGGHAGELAATSGPGPVSTRPAGRRRRSVA